MSPVWLLMMAICAPVACGLVGLVLPRSAIGARVGLTALGPIGALALLGLFVSQHGTASQFEAISWMPSAQLALHLNPDQFGLFFAFLVSAVGFLIVLYARAYFGPDRDSLYRFYPSLLLFMTAMLGVALADNLMLMLLFWEMTSISSFLLIGWERDDPAAVKKAMQAFVVTGAGGLAMMGGLILLGVHTGQWSYTGLLEAVQGGAVTGGVVTSAAFGLVLFGAAAKSAQVPLHFWLPGAMAAPTPVSAYLHSATMVKAGVYLVGRLWPIFAGLLPMWPKLIVPMGAITMLYGAFIALQKTDLKQIFAYTTVSQLGLLMCMYGLSAYRFDGHPNLIWDVAQILNHALYKAPLFILAGAIGHVASRDLGELKGFYYRDRTARIMTIVLLLAAYGLAAWPGTVSFTAKEFFFYQIYHAYEATHNHWFWLLIGAGVLTGALNTAIFLRLARVLLGKPSGGSGEHHASGHGVHGHDEDDAHGHGGHGDHHHETGLWPAFLWIPGAVIVAFQFIGGLIPGAYEAMFGWLETGMHHYEFHAAVGHFPLAWDAFAHPGVPLVMSLCVMGLGIGLALAPVLNKVYHDPFDQTYTQFYLLATKGGGRVFRLVQTGHVGHYIAFVSLALVGFFLWSIDFRVDRLVQWWPRDAWSDQGATGELAHGVLVCSLVCFSAILLPIVMDRASRVLILGTTGFGVTALYYVYRAPDLALTQISIEIVSLILFLLVLSLLPKRKPPKRVWIAPRVALSLSVGAVMFWLTLTSSTATRPPMPYVNQSGQPFQHLGEFFLRNSYHAIDTQHLHADQLYGGVVARPQQETHGSSGAHGAGHGGESDEVMLHSGAGGNNVVNVILVDFRGFDTMGEITVLGLAAMGVWTLLRHRRRRAVGAEAPMDDASGGSGGGDPAHGSRIDIPDPTGGPDPEDATLRKMMNRMPQTP